MEMNHEDQQELQELRLKLAIEQAFQEYDQKAEAKFADKKVERIVYGAIGFIALAMLSSLVAIVLKAGK